MGVAPHRVLDGRAVRRARGTGGRSSSGSGARCVLRKDTGASTSATTAGTAAAAGATTTAARGPAGVHGGVEGGCAAELDGGTRDARKAPKRQAHACVEVQRVKAGALRRHEDGAQLAGRGTVGERARGE